MKLIEQKHLIAIHQMAESDWEWGYGGNTTNANIKCKLCYGKPTGYAKFIKIWSDGSEVTMDFEKLNEYYPMSVTDLTWHMLKVGYDLFLKSKKITPKL